MRKYRAPCLVLLVFLLPLPLAALESAAVRRGDLVRRGGGWEQRADIEAPAREGGRLLLRADSGAVDIVTGPADAVKCVVTLHVSTGNEAEARQVLNRSQLGVSILEAGGVYITSESPSHGRHAARFRVRFLVTVPPRYNLDVETEGGDINLESHLEGDAKLTTGGGDVQTSDVSGMARIETAGGGISLGKIGGALAAQTAGGGIHTGDVRGAANLETSGGEIATGTVGGELKAETAGGDIVVGGAAGPVQARTAGGQIQIGPTGGSVRAETAGGSIRLQGARGRVEAETAGGSIDLLKLAGAVRASTAAGRILAEFEGNRRVLGPCLLESSVGDVFVYLPTYIQVTIDAAIDTAAGRQLRSDFPLTIQTDKEELVPSTIRGHGALNGGGEILKIRTVAGNIEIRKLDDASLRELQQREDANWKAWQDRQTERERHRQQKDDEKRQRKEENDEDDHEL